MRSLRIELRSESVSADEAFDRISEFEKYPELVDEVRDVTVRTRDDGHTVSDWEVYFRNGPLRWSEVDYFQHDRRRIIFEQLSGDFHIFRGSWAVDPVRAGSSVQFEATFDFGIPSLTGVLEPIATKVLKEGIALVVSRLINGSSIIGDPAVEAVVTRKLARTDDTGQVLTH
ncbi:type II toxin-antitoxin system RatA family toxin [Nocardia pseudobrasiliensis]|uniref:Ribosome-associated toxin RatA of RatAB toxin-antitoxin module n=1 Tax=Nocardia pseudobrasiliensis TaxID=45979 RepID=A0A370IBR8_9NOCA|nr:SRPBCC family protein [Nocardia pseudobrasiliensis]RDI68143.1 ribosome-associated toxin RatA of RatAB toxin-antitoxin module [Nocardia pseudobrasiliensis]